MATRTISVPPELESLFSESERRVAEFFSDHSWDPTQGRIEIAGSRYILIRGATLSVEFFQLIRSLYGSDRKADADLFSSNSLYDIGHNLGKGDARRFQSQTALTNPVSKLSAGPIHLSHAGWAYLDILPESSPTPDENFVLYYKHDHSFESDAWLEAQEHSEYPACMMNAGYSTGWCEESFGIPLEVQEITCRCCGHDNCFFIMAPADKLEVRIEEFLRKHPEVRQHYHGINPHYTSESISPNKPLTNHQREAFDAGHELLSHARKLDAAQNALQTTINELQAEIKERKKIEKKLKQLTSYDTLTGLANRNLFEDTVTRAISSHQRLSHSGALMFIDLDHFKKVNESIGHSAGDQLLVEVAKRIQSVVRPENTLARLGGDEFSLWFENIKSMHAVAKVARTIIAVLDNPIPLQQQDIVITPSIGIALFPTDGNDTEELMRNSHTAMYHAKQLGRNNFQFFAHQMNEKARHRLNLEAMLRQAIEKDEIKLHYQPKVNLKSGRITGVEALARWTHSEMGAISPVEFIPLAEETGLIIPLGQYILEACCKFTRRLLDDGVEFGKVAINLSPRQFRRENLVENIAATLAHYEIPAQRIELEITESALIDDPEQALELLTGIKNLGVQLAIDDFGTGYSSLSYLQMFPLDTLKIDRSFIVGLLDGKQSLPASIVNLAHNLNLNVVAEGVEQAEQLHALKNMNCNEIQGFFYGKPMQEEELIQFLAKQEQGEALMS